MNERGGFDDMEMSDEEWEKFKEGLKQGELGGKKELSVEERGIVNALRRGSGLGPVIGATSRVKKMRGVRVSDDAWNGLREIAAEWGLVWNGEGNLSLLIEMIGLGMIAVEKREDREAGGTEE